MLQYKVCSGTPWSQLKLIVLSLFLLTRLLAFTTSVLICVTDFLIWYGIFVMAFPSRPLLHTWIWYKFVLYFPHGRQQHRNRCRCCFLDEKKAQEKMSLFTKNLLFYDHIHNFLFPRAYYQIRVLSSESK